MGLAVQEGQRLYQLKCEKCNTDMGQEVRDKQNIPVRGAYPSNIFLQECPAIPKTVSWENRKHVQTMIPVSVVS